MTPDVVVIMLGTNDSKMLEFSEKQFKFDYIELLSVFKQMSSKP